MEKEPIKYTFKINHKDNNCEIELNQYIKFGELQNKIKDEMKISDDDIKKMILFYIDSEGDKNIISDDNYIISILEEQKDKNNFEVKMKLEDLPIIEAPIEKIEKNFINEIKNKVNNENDIENKEEKINENNQIKNEDKKENKVEDNNHLKLEDKKDNKNKDNNQNNNNETENEKNNIEQNEKENKDNNEELMILYNMNKNVKKDANEKIYNENNIKLIKKLERKNRILEEKLEQYKQRIKEISIFYEQKLNEMSTKIKINEIAINIKKEVKDNINPELKNEIVGHKIEANKEVNIKEKENENLNKTEKKEKNKNVVDDLEAHDKQHVKGNRSQLYKELNSIDFKCQKCQTFCKECIYYCSNCENTYCLCKSCTKKPLYDEFFEIKIPNDVKIDINYKMAINTFNELIKEIFFEKEGKLIIKELNEGDNKRIKKKSNDLKPFGESILRYYYNYIDAYINPAIQKLDENEKNLINKKLNLFEGKLRENIIKKK